jgi:sec-independent protein translocase protein TatA
MFGRIGFPELLLILAIALVIFGPSKIPDIGKSLGRGIREFRKATQEIQKAVELDDPKEPETKTQN